MFMKNPLKGLHLKLYPIYGERQRENESKKKNIKAILGEKVSGKKQTPKHNEEPPAR